MVGRRRPRSIRRGGGGNGGGGVGGGGGGRGGGWGGEGGGAGGMSILALLKGFSIEEIVSRCQINLERKKDLGQISLDENYYMFKKNPTRMFFRY